MSHLAISLLGTFQITRGSTSITACESNKVRTLLAYLAVESDRPYRRDALAALLWPESAQSTALSSLRNALANLRRAIGDHEANPPYLLITRETVQFNCASDCHLDVADVIYPTNGFHQPPAGGLSADVQTRISAVETYRGPFLEGFSIPDSAAFEEWASLWRERLARLTLEGLRWLAEYYEARREYLPALEFSRRQVALEPWMEEGHCQLMRLLALSGQREQALRQYHIACEILSKDLQTQPSPGTTRLYQEILSGSLSAASEKAGPRHNLPVQTTSFIGREKEIETLKALILSGQTRLVTVTGAGGTGKTRLALRVAEELLEVFPDGVWLVELAALADPTNLLPVTVAAALNLHEVPRLPILQVLVDFLRNKRALILLDTCEHLVDAVAHLVDRILHTDPLVSILITSREILGINGEMPFRCPSLELPEAHSLPLRSEMEAHKILVSCEAVQLFLERSALASPAFVMTEKNFPMIAQVCCRLDGIPLAIELAAARMRILSIEQVAERLDHAFLLLTSGSRTALPRQQTLKATIDWSYNLLSSSERTLLLRLSVFSGGWTLEAAEAVCSGEGLDSASLFPEQILDLLGRLADKSLILVEPGEGGEPRYRMLDTVRQYAHERLLETCGETTLRERHLNYFLQLTEQAEPHLRAWGMIEWLKRLEDDLPNLRLALDWSLSGRVEEGLRLSAALFQIWHLHSRKFEGIQWLERLLDAQLASQTRQAGEAIQPRSPLRRIIRGKALIVAGNLNSYYPGMHAEHARMQLKEAKTIFQELGDLALRYQPLVMLYNASSEEDYRDSLAMARRVGDDFVAAETISILSGYDLQRGDLEQGIACQQEHLALRQKIGDIDGEALALEMLAEYEYLQGNSCRAIERWEASQQVYQMVKTHEWALYFSSLPIWVALVQGDYQRALELSEAQLASGQEISSSLVTVEALGNLCRSAWALKEYDQVAQRCVEVLGPDWENKLPFGREVLFYIFGWMALSRGDYAQAGAYLSRFIKIGSLWKFLSMQALGVLAAVSKQDRHAAVLFGALDQRYSWLKNVSTPAERAEYERSLTILRAALGEAAFAAAWSDGQALTVEQMMELARTIIE